MPEQIGGDKAITSIVSILVSIIGVSILAVLVSSKSQTPAVLQSAGSVFQGILGTALSPVTGAAASGGQPLGGSPFLQSFTGLAGSIG